MAGLPDDPQPASPHAGMGVSRIIPVSQISDLIAQIRRGGPFFPKSRPDSPASPPPAPGDFHARREATGCWRMSIPGSVRAVPARQGTPVPARLTGRPGGEGLGRVRGQVGAVGISPSRPGAFRIPPVPPQGRERATPKWITLGMTDTAACDIDEEDTEAFHPDPVQGAVKDDPPP